MLNKLGKIGKDSTGKETGSEYSFWLMYPSLLIAYVIEK